MLEELAAKPIALPGRETRMYTSKALWNWYKKASAHPQARGRSARSEAGKKHDNPQPLARIYLGDEVGKHRRLDCSALQRCTLVAKRNEWKSFGCGACAGAKHG